MEAVWLNCRNFALAALLILSVGCWEEIRYDPSKYAQSAAQRSEPLAIEPPVLEPPVLEPEPPAPIAQDPLPKEPAPELVKPAEPTLATLPLAWQLGSEWSMAAALRAKGLDTERYKSAWNQAASAAESLQVDLSPLPTGGDQQDRLASTIAYLLESAGPELSRQLSEQNGTRHAALVELATKTHVLLLIYSPRNERMGPIGDAIERAAQSANLPAALWKPLVTLLADRAPFAEIKQAVFLLHEQVPAHLTAEAAAP